MANTAYGNGFTVGAGGGIAAPKQETHQQQNQADKGLKDGQASRIK